MRRGVRATLVLAVLAVLAAPRRGQPVPRRSTRSDARHPSSDGRPTWQTNGTVWTMAYAHGDVYAAGDFTAVRPAGTSVGDPSETPRQFMAAFNATTGNLDTTFNHTFNVRPSVVVASPDGSRVYIGGGFTTVDGQKRNHLAVFSTADQSLLPITTWPVSTNGKVTAMTVSTDGSEVYFGGNFTAVTAPVTGTKSVSTPRTRLGAAASTGTLLASWAPTANNTPYTMLAAPNQEVYIGGIFDTVDGAPNTWSAAALDPATGAVDTTFANGPHTVIPQTQRNSNGTIAIASTPKDIVSDGSAVYFADEGTGGHVFDGTFAVNPDNSLKWKNLCLGATQAIEVVGDYLYKGSHAHDCATMNTNGDPDNYGQAVARHLLSERLEDGLLGPWYPDTNGNSLGPRTMTTDGTRLWLGGDFTTVNGKPQQGIAFFSPGDTKPYPTLGPVAVSVAPGYAEVYVQAPLDLDDTDLTISLYRDASTTPLQTWNVHSLFWKQPQLSYLDTGVAVGETHTYRAVVSDTDNPSNTATRVSDPITISATAPHYAATVLADGPSMYWRLGGTNTQLTADSSSGLIAGHLQFGATPGASGATTDGDTAMNLVGTQDVSGQGSGVVAAVQTTSLKTFSLETWVKTTSVSGGTLMDFGNVQTGLSTAHTTELYLDTSGHVFAGVQGSNRVTVHSSGRVNDGNWHQVVAVQTATYLALYVDGNLVSYTFNNSNSNATFSGYWRIGGDQNGGWPSAASNYFSGQLDEVAVYPMALSSQQVLAHYQAR